MVTLNASQATRATTLDEISGECNRKMSRGGEACKGAELLLLRTLTFLRAGIAYLEKIS